MSVKKYTEQILKELASNVTHLNDAQLDKLIAAIKEANHIFLAGSGRSGIAIRGFANRLMHLGKSVSIVGDVSNPHSDSNDLLIIGSGSGETDSLVSIANKANKAGVKIALVTMDEKSKIGQLAEVIVTLPGVSPKLKNAGITITSIQPMGSAFEQMSFLTYDGIILELMEHLDETTESMFPRHADLE
ncbi:6-phospho-3-hexuloisomerase [Amphibacillus marinus]|uniref:6-phospho-3-hexuloisomerase n=1 Tax=Amphibacillus marinus TaxID=872970 RepID=A0A1H8T7V1_9BACI|nr:6-phospho-3-hexuloisomerase [Amphibacillus marinus]SEO86796.1 6-phospho-3-hexuloisomerase [Amphibacillus marinus]